MDVLNENAGADEGTEAVPSHLPQAPRRRSSPDIDIKGRILPISPETQARNARAIAELVEQMLAMPDEDPPGAWEEAMRDLDAHRPHRKLFEGLY